MSLTTSEMTPADIRACMGNDNGDMWGGNNAWWIVILLLFGWGRNGFNGNSNGGGAVEGYTLATDFANIERKLDGINNGICDSTFALTNTINSNFRTMDGAICNLGYQALQNTNAIQTQLADCCCTTQQNIERNTNQGILNTNAIQQQISSCCCDLEKANMQNRFDAQAYNCNTLQAIDKLGDRIENRINAFEFARNKELLDAERTKNAVLQGQIDRAQLRYDIVNDMRPMPIPAYQSCNPWAASYGCGACAC